MCAGIKCIFANIVKCLQPLSKDRTEPWGRAGEDGKAKYRGLVGEDSATAHHRLETRVLPAPFLFLTQCQALESCPPLSNLETAVGMYITEQDALWTKVLKENQNGRLASTPPLDSL